MNEEHYSKLISNARDVILTVDMDGTITSLNSFFETFTGWPTFEWLGRSFYDLLLNEDRVKAYEQFNHTLNGATLRALRLRMHSRAGEILVVEMNLSLQIKGDQVIGLLGIARDKTLEHRMEGALKASEERYRMIAQYAEDIIWTVNMQLQLTYASPSLERALGYSIDELMVLTPAQLLTPESLAIGLSAFRDEVEAVQPQPEPDYARVLQLEHRCKSGSTIWFEMKFSFLRDGDGTPIGVLGVGRDITDRRRVEKALKHRVKELQLLQATVLEITAPHELSNLLYTIVQRAVDLLEASGGELYLCNSRQQETFCVVSYNTQKDYAGLILKYGDGAAGHVAQSGKPLIVDDYSIWPGRASVFEDENPFERLASAPMLWQSQVIGVINVLRSRGDAPFSQENLDLLSHFAHHAAIAVANARQLDSIQTELTERKQAEEKLQVYTHQITLLNEFTRVALEQSALQDTYQMLANRLGELLEADGAYITLWNERQQKTIPIAAYGSMCEVYPTLRPDPGEITLTESVLQAGQVLVVEDVFNTSYLNPRIARLFPTRSILALPMITGQRKLGAALIAFNSLHHFTEEEVALGEQTARQISLVIAHLIILQETERLAKEQSLLFRATRDFSAELDEESVLSTIVHHMTAAVNVDGCTISHYEQEQDCIVTMLDYNKSPKYQPELGGTTHKLEDYPITRHVLESHQPRIIRADDPAIDPAKRVVLEQYGYKTVLLLPLTVGERVFGLVELSRKSVTTPFSNDDVNLAQNLAGAAAVALENALLHADVQTMAITDSLTGLANRRVFDRVIKLEIARALRYSHPVTLLFLDIDSFKQYNDTYGHPAGDERLKAIARLLQDNVRHPDLIARFGGEEFVIIFPYIDKTKAIILAERLRTAAENMYHISTMTSSGLKEVTRLKPIGQPISGYTVSIGVATFPEDARTTDGLLQAADEAVIAAKRQGKNRVCIAPASNSVDGISH